MCGTEKGRFDGHQKNLGNTKPCDLGISAFGTFKPTMICDREANRTARSFVGSTPNQLDGLVATPAAAAAADRGHEPMLPKRIFDSAC